MNQWESESTAIKIYHCLQEVFLVSEMLKCKKKNCILELMTYSNNTSFHRIVRIKWLHIYKELGIVHGT